MLQKKIRSRLFLKLILIFLPIILNGQDKPKVWIYSDMSNKNIIGNNSEGTVNDPDDISAMAGYLLMSNEFETMGIVVTSTHRSAHKQSGDQAVIIDIGEAKNIHPAQKWIVGERLALSALHVAYGQNITSSGPLYKDAYIDKSQMVISFTNVGKGLVSKNKYGYIQGFQIAGNDHKFVWAQAKIEGNTVIVWSDQVSKPQAVRYAWSDNPDADLYNVEGLPASPFRTDTWKGITED